MDRDNEGTSTELIPIFEGNKMGFFSQRVAGTRDNLLDGINEFEM